MTPRDEKARAAARERTLVSRVSAFDRLPDGARLGLAEVKLIVGLSRATLYRRMAAGTFPAPIERGGRCRWRASDIRTFLDGGSR